MGRSNAARHLARLAKSYANKPGVVSSINGSASSALAGPAVPLPAASSGLLQQTRSKAALAAVQTEQQVHVISDIRVDPFGAVSAMVEGERIEEGVFKNVDGHRFEDGRYKAFQEEISSFVPQERQYTDPVRTFAYGTDASFYRLNPKVVVKVHTEEEIRRILPIAKRHGVPVTFRAAGTSLSGQAITDSVLLKLSHTGKNFRNYTIHVSDTTTSSPSSKQTAAQQG
jgi:D-lactate dehydrogenase